MHLPGLDLMYTKCTISLYFGVNLYTDIYVYKMHSLCQIVFTAEMNTFIYINT